MICPSCSMKNNYYHRYCFNCGTRLINEEYEQKELQSSEEEQLYTEYDEPEEEQSFKEEQPFSDTESLTEEEKYEDEKYSEVVEAILEDSSDTNEPTSPSYIDDSVGFSDTNDLGEEIFPDIDLYYRDEDDTEFDIQTQLPLRRYRKTKRSSNGLQRVIKTFITIILITLIALLVYIGYIEWFQKPAGGNSVTRSIDMDYHVEETDLDGQTARKIIVISSKGEQVKIKDKVAAIIGGKAEIILPDSEFGLNEYEQADGALQVSLPITVLADGYPNRTEDIYFEVPVQTAPLEFVSPANKEAFVDGSVYQLILKVEPGSTVFVNDNNYSHVLDEQGQLSLQLELPDQPEARYEIRVSTRGYADTLDEVVFKRRQMEFALEIDQQIPIKAAEDTWVKITGNTHPEATLSTNLEVRDEIILDSETGNFQLFVKATSKGYTPFILTAKVEGKEDSVLETVIHRQVNENEYTQSAWAFEYENLKAYPELHNGIPFLLTGTVNKVESTGTKTTLLIDVAEQGGSERLVYVDYWGTFNVSPGQQLRVFGNRWGNKNDNPYIIASYIYR